MERDGPDEELVIGAAGGVEIGGETEFEVRTLVPGTYMELRDGAVVRVVENPNDGMWVLCEGSDGEIVPVFCFDFVKKCTQQ
jgi:hypothetical protein